MIFVSFLILLFIAVLLTFIRVENRMVNEYRRMADGVTNLMIDALNPDKMDEYLSENFDSEEYRDIVKYYYELKNNYPDVYYMYVYTFYKGDVPSGTIIIDLEDEYVYPPNQDTLDWVGTTYVILEPFASMIDQLIGSSEPAFDTAYSEDDGYLLSYAKPIFDSEGNYVASACVDFSMEEMHRQNIRFIVLLSIILVLAGAGIMALAIMEIRRMITNPLQSITAAVTNFKYDSESDRYNNLATIENLNLNTRNEIGTLYDALLMSEKDSLYYMSNFKKAENEIHDKDEKIDELGTLALRDAMTHVGNKTAYTQKLSEIQDSDKYAVVFMDVNNLKMINDTYGHDAGDTYIKGCCKVLCDVYEHSPVFRIGGDEFAALLRERDYENREELFREITETFAVIWEEKEDDPVHRFSGSIGMADSTDHETVKETIQAADEAMYRSKNRFKEKYGSYR